MAKVQATLTTLVGQPIIVGEKTYTKWDGDVLQDVSPDDAAKLCSVNGWEPVKDETVLAVKVAVEDKPAPVKRRTRKPVKKAEDKD